jgi:aminoglycoside/choline kinase family phosphotransferase
MHQPALATLFESWAGTQPTHIEALPQSGSDRTYWRLSGGGKSAMGSHNPDARENHAFVALAARFAQRGVRVPQVYAFDAAQGLILQQDLGNNSLLDVVLQSRKPGENLPETTVALYREALSALALLQTTPDWQSAFAEPQCPPYPAFDHKGMIWDLHYFKYCFLKPSGVPFDEAQLEADFEQLASLPIEGDRPLFMHRDFQARNLMVHDGHVWVIDFQSGRIGPPAYDVASLLFQARAQLPAQLKSDLLLHYQQELQRHWPSGAAQAVSAYRSLVLLRALQTLGAYGFRGWLERKTHFLDSIPPALASLEWICEHHWPEETALPHLREVCRSLSSHPKLVKQPTYPNAASLTVRVGSFSYKKGWPQDPTSNGGGFVFDCRALHNPGRYEEYKRLSGLDKPVQVFLLAQSRVEEFLSDARRIVEPSIEQYLERGFTDLMISFGCTGGQHRSVYCAEQMAAHLRKKYGVTVLVEHRERESW